MSFKVGDFVINTKTNKVFQYSVSDLEYDQNHAKCTKDDVLWTPNEGEWCWFWDNCTPHRPTCRQFGYTDNKIYGDCEEVYCDTEQNPYDNCEPFLNSLPSHLK